MKKGNNVGTKFLIHKFNELFTDNNTSDLFIMIRYNKNNVIIIVIISNIFFFIINYMINNILI